MDYDIMQCGEGVSALKGNIFLHLEDPKYMGSL
jgi:hypothetical protein